MTIASSALHSNSTKISSCPHGMPLGACPICNGMAGGNSTTKRDIPRNVGEMTYNQCAAIGAMLKAQKNAKAQMENAQKDRQNFLIQFQKNISSAHQRLMEYNLFIKNALPSVIAKPVVFMLNLFVGNLLIIAINIPKLLTNLSNTLFSKITDISDKLAAVYGELKASVDEKISKFLAGIKKKLKSLFFVFGTEEADDREKEIEEEKRIFELKTVLTKLTHFFHNKSKKDIEDNEYKSAE